VRTGAEFLRFRPYRAVRNRYEHNVVWGETVTFAGGDVRTIMPNFTGVPGESYTLVFHRTESSYGSDGRHGIDNLSFNQTTTPIPELSTIALGVLGAGVLRVPPPQVIVRSIRFTPLGSNPEGFCV
jgi:hypothetical protein